MPCKKKGIMKLQELGLIQHVLTLEILGGSSFKETQILFTSQRTLSAKKGATLEGAIYY